MLPDLHFYIYAGSSWLRKKIICCYLGQQVNHMGNSEPPAQTNIINLRLDITHLYYPAKNSFQKSRLKRREIFTELLLYTFNNLKNAHKSPFKRRMGILKATLLIVFIFICRCFFYALFPGSSLMGST